MAGIMQATACGDCDHDNPSDIHFIPYCSDCVDFTPSWDFDRFADERDSDRHCIYCNKPVWTAEDEDDSELEGSVGSLQGVQYADGFSFVTVYEMDRAYGGPEEGGWWYDTGSVVLCRQVPSQDAQHIADELRVEYPNTGKRYSVVYPGYGDYDVVISDTPGQDYPQHTPHYE